MAARSGSKAGRSRPKLFDRWLRRRTRLDLPLTLAYRRIFILPTAFGWTLGILMGAMLIGSLNFNNNLGLFTTFIVAATAINSMLLSFRNINGLRLQHGTAQPVHAGEPVAWCVSVRNPGPRARLGLRLNTGEAQTVFSLPPESERRVTIKLAPHHRGWHRPGRLRLDTTQPLGFFRAWSWLEPSMPFLVWPQPAATAPPLPEGGEARRGQRSEDREEGEEFHSLRRWREGDPLHRIAWKASQRHQTLLSREFRQERSHEVELRLDRAPGHNLEERISILTTWILRASDEKRRWSLVLGSERIGPDQGETHQHACLRALAEL